MLNFQFGFLTATCVKLATTNATRYVDIGADGAKWSQ